MRRQVLKDFLARLVLKIMYAYAVPDIKQSTDR